MTAQTMPSQDTSSGTSDNPPVMHVVCAKCWPDPKQPGKLAICGHEVQGNGPTFLGWSAPAKYPLCVVCEDLVPGGCPKCGAGR